MKTPEIIQTLLNAIKENLQPGLSIRNQLKYGFNNFEVEQDIEGICWSIQGSVFIEERKDYDYADAEITLISCTNESGKTIEYPKMEQIKNRLIIELNKNYSR